MDCMTRGLCQTTFKIPKKETSSKPEFWSKIDTKEMKDTYTKLGNQTVGHVVIGWSLYLVKICADNSWKTCGEYSVIETAGNVRVEGV